MKKYSEHTDDEKYDMMMHTFNFIEAYFDMSSQIKEDDLPKMMHLMLDMPIPMLISSFPDPKASLLRTPDPDEPKEFDQAAAAIAEKMARFDPLMEEYRRRDPGPLPGSEINIDLPMRERLKYAAAVCHSAGFLFFTLRKKAESVGVSPCASMQDGAKVVDNILFRITLRQQAESLMQTNSQDMNKFLTERLQASGLDKFRNEKGLPFAVVAKSVVVEAESRMA